MIFLDTSFLIGLLLPGDDFFDDSDMINNYILNEKVMINNTVITETLNAINTYNIHKFKRNFLKEFMMNNVIHYLSREDYIKSEILFDYYNGSINFSDCTILYSMQKYSIHRIVSFDSDFEKVKGIEIIK